jgi:hypothetical protein
MPELRIAFTEVVLDLVGAGDMGWVRMLQEERVDDGGVMRAQEADERGGGRLRPGSDELVHAVRSDNELGVALTSRV